MGFGFLFVGFLLTFNVAFGAYTDVFMSVLMLIGLSGLAAYAKGFRLAFCAGIPLAAFHAMLFLASIGELIGLLTLSPLFIRITAIIDLCGKAAFFGLVFWGLIAVSRETSLPKLTAHAIRSLILTPLFFTAGLLLELDVFEYVSVFLQYYLIGYLVFGLLYTLLGAKTLFEAYVQICYEGEEEMERSPSRFAFINKLNDLSDQMSERTLKRREEERRLKAERKRTVEQPTQRKRKKK